MNKSSASLIGTNSLLTNHHGLSQYLIYDGWTPVTFPWNMVKSDVSHDSQGMASLWGWGTSLLLRPKCAGPGVAGKDGPADGTADGTRGAAIANATRNPRPSCERHLPHFYGAPRSILQVVTRSPTGYPRWCKSPKGHSPLHEWCSVAIFE